MRMVFATVLLISGWVVAQEVPLKAPNRDPNPQATRPQNYQGCVIRSNKQVMLTDASGTDYRLVSSARSLDSYVGQEVRITASPMNPNDPSADQISPESQVPKGTPIALDVEQITKVADHCRSPK